MLHAKSTFVAIACLLIGSITAAQADECPENPKALGTSRILTVKPQAFPLVGTIQYEETLRLNSREVVLSFDDGPSSPYTEMVLDAMAAECVKGTFFVLGSSAAEDPEVVRRVAQGGHSIGSHAYNLLELDKIPIEEAKKEIDLGIKAITDALQGAGSVSPFFRAPMLGLTPQLVKHLVSEGQMVWSADVDSLDWTEISEEQVVEEIIKKLETLGKGIVLLHDVQPVTARAMPQLLEELKRRKFKIVHVVAEAAKPKKTSSLDR
jgi:peptidoglycan/xylan/chitin deacetylase (PgdA/CDA1 family)